MDGININTPVLYKGASLRFFEENEHYVTRFCKDDVLLMVYDGVLRFNEDGKEYEIYPGKYFIHKHNSYQTGTYASSKPKYLYVHFHSRWAESGVTLARSGDFDYVKLRPLMEELDRLSHNKHTLAEQSAVFMTILSKLYSSLQENTLAGNIADYISENCVKGVSLDELSNKFHFSKNHIINIFKRQYKTTPMEYACNLKLRKAERLLEVTSKTSETVAAECGFGDYTNFYKLFKRVNGVSPTVYRHNKRITP